MTGLHSAGTERLERDKQRKGELSIQDRCLLWGWPSLHSVPFYKAKLCVHVQAVLSALLLLKNQLILYTKGV